MPASPTALAYAIVVVDAVLLLATILQLVYGIHAKRREAKGTPSAPPRAILVLVIATACLIPSYVFDLSATALLLVRGSTTPPPTGANLALVVVSTALSEGFAPAFAFIAAFDYIKTRVAQSVAESVHPRSRSHRLLQRSVENLLALLLPVCVILYLALFSKAMLATPTTTANYFAFLNTANYFQRAFVAIQALLFVRIAYRVIAAHIANTRVGERDPIISVSMMFYFLPAMFIRTLALLAFTPLASTYAIPDKPAASTGLALAIAAVCGLTIIISIQCLLGAAMRPAGQWSPEAKTPGEREVIAGDVPGDIHGKHKRHDSIALSPTKGTFGIHQGIHVERVQTQE